MLQKINEPISVSLTFDHHKRKTTPQKLFWKGKIHNIENVGLHHTYRNGRTLYHVFSVASKNLFFRIVLNTDNLLWTVEEIADGLPD